MSEDLPDYTNYSLIKAVDESGNLVTVLCDASGRIVSVMKGDYAGTMKTLAVDDKGRIQAVLTDPEDVFGNPNYIGAGELAARLGSIKNFEHRGQVVWMDDFEGSVLRWQPTTMGAGASIALSTARSLSGVQSVKLIASSAAARTCSIIRHLAAPRSVMVGFEFAFTTHEHMDYAEFYGSIYDGTQFTSAIVKVDYDDNKIYYNRSTNGGYTWVDTGFTPQLQNLDYLFRRLKFVYDYGTHTWGRIYFDNEMVDISTQPIYVTANATKKQIRALVLLRGDGAHNPYIYVDDVIVTQNEP